MTQHGFKARVDSSYSLASPVLKRTLKQSVNRGGDPMTNRATFGVYLSRNAVNKAIGLLKSHGFGPEDISVMFPDQIRPPDARGRTRDIPYKQRTLLREGAVIGAVLGAIIIGLVSLLVGMGFFTIPGVSKVLDDTGNQLTATVIGILFGIFAGGFSGALVGIGTPEPATRRYGNYVKQGGIVLSVHVENMEEDDAAREILQTTGARDINALEEEEWVRVVAEGKKPDPPGLLS